MTGSVVPMAGGQVPAIFQNLDTDADDLSAGVSGGFAVVSYRGSKWRVKYQGEEHPLLDQSGDPLATIEVVILRANPHITKNYYEKNYTEGAAEAPDCFSLDGIKPEATSPKLQATSCAKCPKNVFGSRITTDGKPSKAKACQDNRRLAIVPVNDLKNERFGGPMLLRVPASALADLALMGKNLKARGFPYNAVSVKLGFDIATAYPKLTFRPVRPLTEEEGAEVVELMNDDKIQRILAEAVEIEAVEAEATVGTPTVEAPKSKVAPVAEPAKDPLFEAPTPVGAKPATKVAAAPETVAVMKKGELAEDPSLDKDITGILAELGNLG